MRLAQQFKREKMMFFPLDIDSEEQVFEHNKLCGLGDLGHNDMLILVKGRLA